MKFFPWFQGGLMDRGLRFLVPLLFGGTLGAQEWTTLLDDYMDARWSANVEEETARLVTAIEKAGVTAGELEELLRKGRTSYPDLEHPKGKELFLPLTCEHVDYETNYWFYIPSTYDPARAWPLILIGHGGNGAMSPGYAKIAADSGFKPWLKQAEEKGFILAAPLTERGWGAIGNSVLISLLSKLSRQYHLDPDRIYLTGHSMGGHLTWRSGIFLTDRWAAISPMSGGYDYVENQQVLSLFNVPGYATWGQREPYEIDQFNRKIRDWMHERKFNWTLVEKKGGHTIYEDEIPKVAQFFLDHPRNPYPKRVYAWANGAMAYTKAGKNNKWKRSHEWNPQRPIPRFTFHWIRLHENPHQTPDMSIRQELWAEILEENVIRLISDSVRELTLYLHPKMVDFSKPVQIDANGRTIFYAQVQPDFSSMLKLAREFDDRGRIYYTALNLEIRGNHKPPEPRNP